MSVDNIIIKCGNCGTRNRVPRNRMNDRPVCGKCQQALNLTEVHDRPIDVTDQTFNHEVMEVSGPVLVDCWAQWCGPCKQVGPILDEIAKEYTGKLKIAKLNVDQNPVIASRYNIKSIPTMLLMKNGKIIKTLVGAQPKSEIIRNVSSVL